MIPLHDDVPSQTKPIVTVALIALCLAAFLWQQTLSAPLAQRAVVALGFIPAVYLDGRSLPGELVWIPWQVTIFSSMFLHGGWMHLLSNMLYLWIFGNNIEDALGHGRFVVFYLVCGVAAAFVHGLSEPGSPIPLIGASGAISGVLGAYILLFPKARILVLLPIGIVFWTFRFPAVVVLGLWFLIQALNVTQIDSGHSDVAFWAHIGGFIVGMILIHPFKRKGWVKPQATRKAGGIVRRESRASIIPKSTDKGE